MKKTLLIVLLVGSFAISFGVPVLLFTYASPSATLIGVGVIINAYLVIGALSLASLELRKRRVREPMMYLSILFFVISAVFFVVSAEFAQLEALNSIGLLLDAAGVGVATYSFLKKRRK